MLYYGDLLNLIAELNGPDLLEIDVTTASHSDIPWKNCF